MASDGSSSCSSLMLFSNSNVLKAVWDLIILLNFLVSHWVTHFILTANPWRYTNSQFVRDPIIERCVNTRSHPNWNRRKRCIASTYGQFMQLNIFFLCINIFLFYPFPHSIKFIQWHKEKNTFSDKSSIFWGLAQLSVHTGCHFSSNFSQNMLKCVLPFPILQNVQSFHFPRVLIHTIHVDFRIKADRWRLFRIMWTAHDFQRVNSIFMHRLQNKWTWIRLIFLTLIHKNHSHSLDQWSCHSN